MRTAMMALQCALEIKDWQVAAEALVMLKEAADQSREAYLEEIAHFHGGGASARLVPLS